MEILVILSAASWLFIWGIPWRPWSTRESLEAPDGPGAGPEEPIPGGLVVLIPARDEADGIERTLLALRDEAPGVRVILIDDKSTDDTAARARGVLPPERLTVISGQPLPDGWSGKLWALEQGWQAASATAAAAILLLDADIELAPRMVTVLSQKLESESLDLVSVMAELRMESFWEKLLVPAFVHFFKLLYPFALSNDPRSQVAAAAGGCILIRAQVLKQIGGFASIRGALIDDCTLARRVKATGGRTWLGLSHSVRSHRAYQDLHSLWNMVARNAFTQLRYSLLLLLVTSVLLFIVFWAPLLGLFFRSTATRTIGAAAFVLMAAAYLPILRYYRRSALWAAALPAIAALYLLMTWSSALRYWRGRRSMWEGIALTEQVIESLP